MVEYDGRTCDERVRYPDNPCTDALMTHHHCFTPQGVLYKVHGVLLPPSITQLAAAINGSNSTQVHGANNVTIAQALQGRTVRHLCASWEGL